MVVHLVGDGQQEGTTTVSASDIGGWAATEGNPPTEFQSRDDNGVMGLEGVAQSLPLRNLIAHLADRGGAFADLQPEDISLVRIPRTGVGVATLVGQNLGPPGSNGFIEKEPVLYTPAGTDSVHYGRPLKGPEDVNKNDFFQSLGNGALDITLSTTGILLHPEITMSPTDPDAGDTVAFSATVPGAPAGMTYSWKFGGGATSTAAAPHHSWSQASFYGVALEVEAPDGSFGQTTVTFTVGDPPSPTPSPAKTPPPGGGGGGGSGGGKPNDPSKPTPTSTGSADPSATASADGQATTGGPGTSNPGAEADVPDSAPAGSTPTAAPSAPPPVVDGRTVTGLLLSAGAVTDDGGAEAPTVPDTASTVTPPEHDLRISTGVWLALAAVALLGAGAASELRPRRSSGPTHEPGARP